MITLYEHIDHYLSYLIHIKAKVPSSTQSIVYLKPLGNVLGSVLSKLKSNNFSQIVISGYQGSGKTTTAYYIAKWIQVQDVNTEYITIAINAIAINPSKLLEIKNKHNTNNLILILDDTSYVISAMGRKESSLFKNLIATIRHIFSGKVLLIVITHVDKGIPPILRNCDTFIYMSITEENELYDKGNRLINVFNSLRFKGKAIIGDKVVILEPNTRASLSYVEGTLGLYHVPYTSKGEIARLEEISEYVRVIQNESAKSTD